MQIRSRCLRDVRNKFRCLHKNKKGSAFTFSECNQITLKKNGEYSSSALFMFYTVLNIILIMLWNLLRCYSEAPLFPPSLFLSLYHYYIITMRFKQLFEHYFTSPSLIIHNILVWYEFHSPDITCLSRSNIYTLPHSAIPLSLVSEITTISHTTIGRSTL